LFYETQGERIKEKKNENRPELAVISVAQDHHEKKGEDRQKVFLKPDSFVRIVIGFFILFGREEMYGGLEKEICDYDGKGFCAEKAKKNVLDQQHREKKISRAVQIPLTNSPFISRSRLSKKWIL
jgi:hypothetical protein